MTIRGDTTIVGVIGYPVEHSCSPQMHNAAFRHLGMNWCYVAFRVEPARIEAAIRAIPALNLRGLNVTIPHKQDALRLMDEVTEYARQAQAVNTIENRQGVLVGWNTDVEGFLACLTEQGVAVAGRRALLLGAGGAAWGVSVALAKGGAHSLVIANRTLERAQRLSLWIGDMSGGLACRAVPLEATKMAEYGPFDLVVNTTSLGMSPAAEGCAPLAWEALAPEAVVVDTVFNPQRTKLLTEAERRGFGTVEGLGMLLHQGAIAFRIWTGVEPPLAVMRRALKKALREGGASHS